VVLEKDFKSSQREIAQYLDIPVIEAPVQKIQADESVRYEFTVSKELDQKIKEAQALLSHAVGSNDVVAFLSYVTERVIAQKTNIRKSKNDASEENHQNRRAVQDTSARNESTCHKNDGSTRDDAASTTNKSKARVHRSGDFSDRNKKIILRQDECCQFVDPLTLRKCQSKWFLQVDHIRPQWAGGDNHVENGQLLCAAHNKFRYSQQSNIRRSS
jgi:hypothetical protein